MNRIQRSITEPLRVGLSWSELWEAEDDGLIACWESGRSLALREPAIAMRARAGALPPLPWKGGTVAGLKKKSTGGTLYYFAMWQGLRGDDLDVSLAEGSTQVCAETGVAVTFTADPHRWAG